MSEGASIGGRPPRRQYSKASGRCAGRAGTSMILAASVAPFKVVSTTLLGMPVVHTLGSAMAGTATSMAAGIWAVGAVTSLEAGTLALGGESLASAWPDFGGRPRPREWPGEEHARPRRVQRPHDGSDRSHFIFALEHPVHDRSPIFAPSACGDSSFDALELGRGAAVATGPMLLACEGAPLLPAGGCFNDATSMSGGGGKDAGGCNDATPMSGGGGKDAGSGGRAWRAT